MPVISKSFDLQSVEWRHVSDPNCKDFRVDFESSLLGYDLPSGRLDMLLRYGSVPSADIAAGSEKCHSVAVFRK